MKCNKWTLALVSAGLITMPAISSAEEEVNSVLTALSATTLSGYINTSAHWVPGSAKTTAAYAYGGFVPGIADADIEPDATKDDGFNLNVVGLTIAKPISEEAWSAGYKAEFWFGPDANLLFNNSLGVNVSDFNVKQAYVQLGVPIGNTLDVKMGVWDTVVGYEVANAGDNPNYTRSWGYTVEPTQHTGILGSYRFTEFIAATFGIANTWDSRINGRAPGESMKSYLGSITLTAPESFGFLKGATLTGGVVDGRTTGGGPPDRTSLYVGASIPTPVEGLAVGLAWDHVNLDDQNGVSTHDTDVLGAYVLFKATEKLTLNFRGEYVHWGDLPGVAGTTFEDGGFDAFATGDEIISFTATIDYALWKSVISRLEYRWDHDLDNDDRFGGGTRNNDHLVALNLIYKF